MSRLWPRAFGVVVGLGVCAAVLGLTRGTGAEPARTVFLVRHGDTDPKGEADPPLTQAGAERAARLARALGDEPMSAVFVTRTARSMQTGSPAALHNGIEPTVYPPTAYDDLRARILAQPAGSACLVVAHSNTVPAIARALGAREMDELPEKEFDRLFVCVLEGERLVRMVELRY